MQTPLPSLPLSFSPCCLLAAAMLAPPRASRDAAACLGQLARRRSACVSLARMRLLSLGQLGQSLLGAVGGSSVPAAAPFGLLRLPMRCSLHTAAAPHCAARLPAHRTASLHCTATLHCTAPSLSAPHHTALHCSGCALPLCRTALMLIAHRTTSLHCTATLHCTVPLCTAPHSAALLRLCAAPLPHCTDARCASHNISALHCLSALHCTVPLCTAPHNAALLRLCAAPLLHCTDAHCSLRSAALRCLAYTHLGCSTYWLLSI